MWSTHTAGKAPINIKAKRNKKGAKALRLLLVLRMPRIHQIHLRGLPRLLIRATPGSTMGVPVRRLCCFLTEYSPLPLCGWKCGKQDLIRASLPVTQEDQSTPSPSSLGQSPSLELGGSNLPSTFMIWYVSWTTLYLGSFRKACAQAWIRYRILFRTLTSTCLCRARRKWEGLRETRGV